MNKEALIYKAKTNQELFALSQNVMPGGVSSSTRLCKSIGMPFYASKGKGSRLWTVDGREVIDMCCAHGAGLLGNAHPAIDEAMHRAIEMGFVNSHETEYHFELAQKVCNAIPCADKVRFCSSGSEATMHLIRACRAYTGKNKILRIEGHFHGYHELIYIGGHPPKASFPDNKKYPFIESPGIPKEFAELIIPVPFNDKDAFDQALLENEGEIAMVIMEPVNYNCAGIVASQDYLQHVRRITKDLNIVLFFDEVQSAFKKLKGGAQEDFEILPDVCTIGKSLGGGLPLSAFCGKAEIMDMFQPVGQVQHSGTFNAHLVPVLAGLAFMEEIEKEYFYPHLQKLEKHFRSGIEKIISANNLNIIFPFYGARFNIVIGRNTPALRYEDTFCHDHLLFLKILRDCWNEGVYFHDYGGSPSHHGFSIQHTTEDIDSVLDVLEKVFTKYNINLSA